MRVLSVMLVSLMSLTAPAASLPEGAIQIRANTIVWKPAPPSLPAGTEIAVLEGNPGDSGIFTMRVKVPAGARLAPHIHPKPERVTIISGVVGLGLGTHYDQTRLKIFRAGDYYLTPPDVPHFLSFAEHSVVQITGHGPWAVSAVNP